MELSNRPSLDPEETQEALSAGAVKDLMQALHQKLKEHGACCVAFEDEKGVPISVSDKEAKAECERLTVIYDTSINLDGTQKESDIPFFRYVFELNMGRNPWTVVIAGHFSLQETSIVASEVQDGKSRYIQGQLQQFVAQPPATARWFDAGGNELGS